MKYNISMSAAKKEKKVTTPSMRPPIVAVLGHVDHGKTSLLDFIRKSRVAEKEFGGITQHIGAYQIEVGEGKEQKHTITFIDTPGHEAFAKMRSRGAKVADIAILVVAADDSVKPQTIESIRMIKEADVPMIVAVNKIDLETANMGKVKSDLAKHSVQVEGFGGDIPIVPVSAKSGKGVKELLEMIVLVGEMHELINEKDAPLEAVVIETKIDKGKGMLATVVVKKGTLRHNTELYEHEKKLGKVRAMMNEYGEREIEALPGKPVEIFGFDALPNVGEVLTDTAGQMVEVAAKKESTVSPLDFLNMPAEKKQIKLVLKTDTAGSKEAIIDALGETCTIIYSQVGEISEKDVLLAKPTGAFVIGFNVKIAPGVEMLAQTEGVVCRVYTIIYELLDEMHDVLEGMEEVLTKERELGKAKILAEFPFNAERVAGVKVTDGRIAKGDQVKVISGTEEKGRGRVRSVRKGKEDVTKVEKGSECGVVFDRKVDFSVDDDIIAFTNS